MADCICFYVGNNGIAIFGKLQKTNTMAMARESKNYIDNIQDMITKKSNKKQIGRIVQE